MAGLAKFKYSSLQQLSRQNLNDRSQTDLIIMDFSKAFSKVSHPKLLAKRDHYGIRNDALKWISCFLNRIVNKVSWSIGPTLFLIYINDLPDYVNSAVHLFADDTIMYLTVHNEDHCDQLQADIDQLQLWEKHELLRITRKRTAIE